MKKQSFMWVVSLLIAGSAGVAKADENVWAWGSNDWGQLGDSTNTWQRNQPVRTKILTNVLAICAGKGGGGYDFSLAINYDSTVWAWGYNAYGQLGDSTTFYYRYNPVRTKFLTNVVAISAGGSHSLALKSDSIVWAWGSNGSGVLGDSTVTAYRRYPVQTKLLTNVIAISAGGSHSLALKSDGTVWAWGYNGSGQLGIGSSDYNTHFVPVQTNLLTNVVAISAGGHHSLALKSDSTVWAWGYNYYGQLGDSTTTQNNQPVKVKLLTGVIAISAGGAHSLALKPDGTVWAWGYNGYGELGIGSSDYNPHSVPLQTLNLTNAVAISAGGEHSLALIKSDSTVWAWGQNGYGQLGDSTGTQRNQPVQTSLLTGVTAISAGWNYSLALKYVKVGIEEKSKIKNQISKMEIIKDKIYLSVPKSINAELKIYDLCGRTKEVIYNGALSKGDYVFTPNIKKSGVYFVRVTTNNFKETKKMVLIK
ncbi:MAG: T9SS type A sorting domain-containing protein [bacterium]|nr:T9SS type A sorting domain-containing protein [bacterium]